MNKSKINITILQINNNTVNKYLCDKLISGLKKHRSHGVCIIYRKTNKYFNSKLLMLCNCVKCYDFNKYQL